MGKESENSGASPVELQQLVHLFFSNKDHKENGKSVSGVELMVMRPETIGQGQFSRVRLVEVKLLRKFLDSTLTDYIPQDAPPEITNGVFALKIMKKTEVLRLKQVEHVKAEADILSRVSHPFIVTLYNKFADERNLYLLEEFVQLGPLSSHIKNQKTGRLPNETARFCAAQVVMAVQYLHQEHIIYRDLNPENVMLDRHHYVKLVDFGLAKALDLDKPNERAWTLCGQPEYIAPEIVQSKGHSKEVDWWALGIIIHEMLAGYPPFFGKSAYDIFKKIMDMNIDLPIHFEIHAKDLLKKLLVKDRTKRMGASKNGAEDIKKHKWFRGLNWAALYNKQMQPPLEPLTSVPKVSSATDTSNFESYPTSSDETGPVLDDEKNSALFDSW